MRKILKLSHWRNARKLAPTDYPTTRFDSPLRYPGGKSRLTPFFLQVLAENSLLGATYAEPYAGGAGVALGLLFSGFVERIEINDVDPGIFAFWHSVLYETAALCSLIRKAPVTVNGWAAQRKTQLDQRKVSLLELGFSTFFLNRTNRSGIILGGPIGGKAQSGTWRMDARFNRAELIGRIQRIAALRDQIAISNLDALDFLAELAVTLPTKSIVYCDPPYFVKGRSLLYRNFYRESDHREIAAALISTPFPWVVSYDDAPEIRKIYRGCQRINYDINYCAKSPYRGKEVMFFSNDLTVPNESNPAYLFRSSPRHYRTLPKG